MLLLLLMMMVIGQDARTLKRPSAPLAPVNRGIPKPSSDEATALGAKTRCAGLRSGHRWGRHASISTAVTLGYVPAGERGLLSVH